MLECARAGRPCSLAEMAIPAFAGVARRHATHPRLRVLVLSRSPRREDMTVHTVRSRRSRTTMTRRTTMATRRSWTWTRSRRKERRFLWTTLHPCGHRCSLMTVSAPWLLLVVLTNSISAYYFYYYSVTMIARSALARGVARRHATSSLVESHSVNKGHL